MHGAVSQRASKLTDTRRRYKHLSHVSNVKKAPASFMLERRRKKMKKEEENLGRNLCLFTRKLNELTGARFRFVTLMMSLADTSVYESVLVFCALWALCSLASAERQQFFFFQASNSEIKRQPRVLCQVWQRTVATRFTLNLIKFNVQCSLNRYDRRR